MHAIFASTNTEHPHRSLLLPQKGIRREIVETISAIKNEPAWMRQLRLQAYRYFGETNRKLPGFDPTGLFYSLAKFTADERGDGQYRQADLVHERLLANLRDKGVLFTTSEEGLRRYPDIFSRYFATAVPTDYNYVASLNASAWSNGTFLYVPRGVHVDVPLQAYFRIHTQNQEQFTRTLIVAEEGASVEYIEGCTAPNQTWHPLHCGVVEVIVKKGARVRYTTLQNWSKSLSNLPVHRAIVEEDGIMEWVDVSLGSKRTQKTCCCDLRGANAHAEVSSLLFAGENQSQELKTRVVHGAKNTSSQITCRSLGKDGGAIRYRPQIAIETGAVKSKAQIQNEALVLDTMHYICNPNIETSATDARVIQQNNVGKIDEEQIFYLRSRGLSREDAESMIVRGFTAPILAQLPMEYAVELDYILELAMTNAIG